MTEPSKHCGDEQLQMLLDGTLKGKEEEDVLLHLQSCSRCTAVFEGFEQTDRGLRRLPLSSTSREFTRRVMDEVMPSGHLSLAFRIVENLAYLFAALFVTGIIAVVFIATGVIETSQVNEGRDIFGTYTGAMSDWLANALHGGASWLERYLPSKGGTSILLFGAVVLAALALLDRLLTHKFADRTR
jgi:hypothetical protein